MLKCNNSAQITAQKVKILQKFGIFYHFLKTLKFFLFAGSK